MRLWKKLQCWKEKLLSQDGKEILLKAVALTLSLNELLQTTERFLHRIGKLNVELLVGTTKRRMKNSSAELRKNIQVEKPRWARFQKSITLYIGGHPMDSTREHTEDRGQEQSTSVEEFLDLRT